MVDFGLFKKYRVAAQVGAVAQRGGSNARENRIKGFASRKKLDLRFIRQTAIAFARSVQDDKRDLLLAALRRTGV